VQLVPHAPQLPSSVCRSTHAAPHIARGAAHGDAHVPPVHARPAAHTVPHAPQFVGSVAVSTHLAPHRASGAEHGRVHEPAAQGCPAGHPTPHAPQCAGSVAVSTHRPPQWVWPAGHDPEQTPATHVAVPPIGAVQIVPQRPQSVGLVASVVSQPSAIVPLQLPNPAVHAMPHVIEVHVGVALGRAGHGFAQAPQCEGLVARSTQTIIAPVAHTTLGGAHAAPSHVGRARLRGGVGRHARVGVDAGAARRDQQQRARRREQVPALHRCHLPLLGVAHMRRRSRLRTLRDSGLRAKTARGLLDDVELICCL
jgi:hypothetical protein